MLHILRMGLAVLAVAAFSFCLVEPAQAACQLIKATHSAGSKADAARASQALVLEQAAALKRAKRWGYVSLSARKVQGDPFWKAVRPDGVPAEARLKPDIVTSRFFTTCFTGVVVPFVCTTGSAVCGN
ncbi:MAG TPA: hypothetical protein VEW64_04625 [Methyloceanibacter sp.]|jgi:hypothetical protein|nr:hypothetical protein [Methyloceanibacter sp.]